jgi:hypothetical protein
MHWLSVLTVQMLAVGGGPYRSAQPKNGGRSCTVHWQLVCTTSVCMAAHPKENLFFL